MKEVLNAFDRFGEVVKKKERSVLLQEMEQFSEKQGDAPFAVACVQVLLQNKDGKFYIVQRNGKPENPYLFDKTVEGHVRSGEPFEHAMHRECAEELGVMTRLVQKRDFKKIVKGINTKKIALVYPLKLKPWVKSVRVNKKGKVWVKRIRAIRYVGRYDGLVQFKDREARAVRLLSKEEVRKQVKKHPKKFTYDMVVLFK